MLIEDPSVGDVYNLLDTGANYVYTDEKKWDKLSETINLSPYIKKTDVEKDYIKKVDFDELVKRVEKLEKGGTENG